MLNSAYAFLGLLIYVGFVWLMDYYGNKNE